MRLFTAIQLPDDVRDQVARLSAHYCDRLTARLGIDVDPTAIKWVREDNLHVTLKFLGDVADEDVLPLCDALAQIAPVTEATLRVDRADCLPPRGPIRIIAAGLGGDVHLVELLFAAIERACEPFGIAREHRRYRPHITLARLRKPLPAMARPVLSDLAGECLSNSAFFRAAGFALVQSILLPKGPQHAPIAIFPRQNS